MKNRARILLTAVLAIAVALLGLIFIRNLIDFPVYYAAGQSLISGRTDLYASDFAMGRVMDYRYPPFFLLALIPFWLLPYKAAAYVWYSLSLIEIALCVVVLRRLLSQCETKAMWVVAFFSVAGYFVMILHYGNAHLLAVSLMFVSFYLVIQRKTAAAALTMALAITIKLVPALLLPYFAIKKQWKFLLLTGFFLLAINLAPAAYLGLDQNAGLLKAWYEKVILDQEFHEVNGPINLSLKGQLRRYLSEVDYTQRIDGDTRYPDVNFASLETAQTDAAWMVVIAGAFFSGLALIWWRSRNRYKEIFLKMYSFASVRDANEETGESDEPPNSHQTENLSLSPLEIGFMICLMLLAGPLTSKIYFIALLWPVACLSGFAFNNSTRSARFARRALVFISIANFVLPLLPGRSIQRLLLVIGVDFYLNCILLAAIAYVLISDRRALPRSVGGSQIQSLPSARRPLPLRRRRN